MKRLLPALVFGFPAYWVLLTRSLVFTREMRVPISQISPSAIRRQLLLWGIVLGLFFIGFLIDYFLYHRSDFVICLGFPVFYCGVLLGAGLHFLLLKKSVSNNAL